MFLFNIFRYPVISYFDETAPFYTLKRNVFLTW